MTASHTGQRMRTRMFIPARSRRKRPRMSENFTISRWTRSAFRIFCMRKALRPVSTAFSSVPSPQRWSRSNRSTALLQRNARSIRNSSVSAHGIRTSRMFPAYSTKFKRSAAGAVPYGRRPHGFFLAAPSCKRAGEAAGFPVHRRASRRLPRVGGCPRRAPRHERL